MKEEERRNNIHILTACQSHLEKHMFYTALIVFGYALFAQSHPLITLVCLYFLSEVARASAAKKSVQDELNEAPHQLPWMRLNDFFYWFSWGTWGACILEVCGIM